MNDMRESVIAKELAGWAPVLREQLLAGADAVSVEAELQRLGFVRCFFFEGSVGALFGVELEGGQRVALKLHQTNVGPDELIAMQRVQAHLADNGFPCPAPVLPPTPFLGRFATGEEWLDEGVYACADESRRPIFAALLARLVELSTPVDAGNLVSRLPDDETLWPRPHNALFDFEATAAGAEWIDEIARLAKERHRAGPRVIAHQDWTFRHIRWQGVEPTVVYDWDSLSCDHESIAIGGSAATHSAPPGPFNGWRPAVDDALSFMDAYEAVRPLTAETRRAAEAHTVYSVAYTARCEHAFGPDPVTSARSVLSEFAERFLR